MKSKVLIFGIIGVAFVLVLILVYSIQTKNLKDMKNGLKLEAEIASSGLTTIPQNSPTESKTYTLDEISTHNAADNCWFAINDSVYDVTKFIASENHPGGEAILAGCGKDATEIYSNKPKTGRDHSANARAMLEGYNIGILSSSE